MNPQPTPDFSAEDRSALLDTVKRFATQVIAPNVNAWDEAGEVPRALYRQAAELGLLGLGYPEALGGTPAPWSVRNAMSQTLARWGGSGGVMASLFSHNIGLPPVLAHGTAEQKAQIVPPVLRGEQIAALGITEPGGGSDVAGLRCTARLDGGDYVIDGEKVFITSGMRCDWITLAVRTDLKSKGASGLSLIAVPCDAKGLSRTPLQKMGWLCSDTAHLRFNGLRVPARYRLGEEGAGFRMIMGNFNGERLALAAMALGFSEACYDEALAWARQRQTFGAPLIERQVIRHKLMDMQMRIASTQTWVDALGARADAGDQGPEWVGHVCLLKNHATQTMQFCADTAVQILGGMGFMRGTVSERLYREVKVMMIGGGAEEIMKELAARQLGL
ncbi:MAG: acyl-CoA dehydrogenase family protein [Gammaproteobacteria bacterium]|uniref:acyl-CoA dehydrogenase family protein n=1 Tax=Hydrogenophaga sp. TaxID=1904254 RepID=UPI0025B8DD63|nr:acyl-CoA dehydrogenase family protein [Hydrogenophaga sp.]MBU4182396.1 acyl-CoA dehydrogenase family protein [Gammaproteobacteria bacterium]MBU4278925.1 acyl-CoA dehydrogenase family protein [Gammaproteobacteria bacterium]MBU4325617.1 acyl-CoA dehydrogenase family protein [Gammaproteobacteria bacterium]MBU4507876.1 acyl-CoA dehydrogenase family protein [Gammaproteobacteria bacterium]MCG2657986.1 acyl-CoA dehydrogenase family protein [Hydrogenophaga sp.]